MGSQKTLIHIQPDDYKTTDTAQLLYNHAGLKSHSPVLVLPGIDVFLEPFQEPPVHGVVEKGLSLRLDLLSPDLRVSSRLGSYCPSPQTQTSSVSCADVHVGLVLYKVLK